MDQLQKLLQDTFAPKRKPAPKVYIVELADGTKAKAVRITKGYGRPMWVYKVGPEEHGFSHLAMLKAVITSEGGKVYAQK